MLAPRTLRSADSGQCTPRGTFNLHRVCVLERSNYQGESDPHVARHGQQGHWRDDQRLTRPTVPPNACRDTPESPPLPAQSRPTVPASTSSQQTPGWAAPGPVHHGGSLFLLTWCPGSACTCPAPPSLPGPLASPTPSTRKKLLQPHRPAVSSPLVPLPGPSPPCWSFPAPRLPGLPHPHPWEPAASRAQPSSLSPPLSPGPSHSPSPRAPSSSFQPKRDSVFLL